MPKTSVSQLALPSDPLGGGVRSDLSRGRPLAVLRQPMLGLVLQETSHTWKASREHHILEVDGLTPLLVWPEGNVQVTGLVCTTSSY